MLLLCLFEHNSLMSFALLILSSCLSVGRSVDRAISLSVCLSVGRSGDLSVCPSVCLFVCPSVCLTVCLSLRTLVSPFVRPSVLHFQSFFFFFPRPSFAILQIQTLSVLKTVTCFRGVAIVEPSRTVRLYIPRYSAMARFG